MRWYTLVALGVALIVYTVIGGVIFSSLEKDREQDLRDEILTNLRSFIDDEPCVNMTTLGQAYELLMEMKENGLEVNSEETGLVRKSLWDMRSSIFVSIQLIATIGFPSAAPRSGGGRAFTVPYAILGIPLFLLTAIGVGQVLNSAAEALRKLFVRCCCREAQCNARLIRTIIVTTAGIIFFIIIPSIIFKQIEPWTYGDAFYFSFITLATIGFGDLVPSYNDVKGMSDNYREWYRLAIGFWILLLGSWLAGVIVSIQTTITAPALTYAQRFGENSSGDKQEVLDHHIATNLNMGLRSDMKTQLPAKYSTYNHYLNQKQWQQQQPQYSSGGQSPYDVYNPQRNWQQQSAYDKTTNQSGAITRIAV